MSKVTIALKCNCSVRTIHRILKNISDRKTGQKAQYNGKNFKNQIHRAVRIFVKSKEKVSLRTLQKMMNVDKNLIYKKIQKKICLNQLQMQKRVSIIREWFAKRVNFENVIFSNESRISLDGPDHFMSWQLPQYSESFSRLKRPCNGVGIMVHGVLHLDGTCLLYTSPSPRD